MPKNYEPAPDVVYCLKAKSSKSKGGLSYIGVSKDHINRQRQHNQEIVGGAKYTKKAKNWKHVFIVNGFPRRREALQLENLLQHPRRIKNPRWPKGKRNPFGTYAYSRRAWHLYWALQQKKFSKKAHATSNMKFVITWRSRRFLKISERLKWPANVSQIYVKDKK